MRESGWRTMEDDGAYDVDKGVIVGSQTGRVVVGTKNEESFGAVWSRCRKEEVVGEDTRQGVASAIKEPLGYNAGANMSHTDDVVVGVQYCTMEGCIRSEDG